MRKLLVFLAAFVMGVACTRVEPPVAPPRPAPIFESPFPATDDSDARRIQDLATQVVEVRAFVLSMLQKTSGPNSTVIAAYSTVMHGSGFVVAVRRGNAGSPASSLVMTNSHVCKPPLNSKIIMEELQVKSSNGGTFTARVLANDPLDDTCSLEVDGIPGNVVKLSDSEPPFGGSVERLGNDMIEFKKNLEIYASGKYSGKADAVVVQADEEKKVTEVKRMRLRMSMMASMGASGSPVFYRGNVIGMAVSIPVSGSSHILYCVGMPDIRRSMGIAQEMWK